MKKSTSRNSTIPTSSCSAELASVTVIASVTPSRSAAQNTPGMEPTPASTVTTKALTVRAGPSAGCTTLIVYSATPATLARMPATMKAASSTRLGSMPISIEASRLEETARTARPYQLLRSHHHRPAMTRRLTTKASSSLFIA